SVVPDKVEVIGVLVRSGVERGAESEVAARSELAGALGSRRADEGVSTVPEDCELLAGRLATAAVPQGKEWVRIQGSRVLDRHVRRGRVPELDQITVGLHHPAEHLRGATDPFADLLIVNEPI